MAHQVHARPDTQIVAHKDFEVTVHTDGRKLGTLLISRGNVESLPKGNFVNERRLTWAQFGELMSEYGKPVKKPR